MGQWLAFGEKKGEYIFLGLLVAFGLVSLIIFIRLADVNPAAAYFLPSSRFWELAIGSGLFLIQQKNHRVTAYKGNDCLGCVCLAAMVAAMLLLKQDDIEISTITVVLAASAYIFFIKSSDRSYWLMSNDQIVGIGLMSYSLYLWHWSVLVVTRLSVGVNEVTMPFMLLITFACSYGSYRWVEKPLRSSQWAPSGLGTIILGSTIVASMAGMFQAAAAASSNWLYVGSRLEVEKFSIIPKQFPGLSKSQLPYHTTCVIDGIQKLYNSETFNNCTWPASSHAKSTLFFMGDSHTGHLLGLAVKLHKQAGFGVHLIETPGEPFPREPLMGSGIGKKHQRTAQDKILKRVLETGKRGDVVVISRLFTSRLSDAGAQKSLMSAGWLKNVGDLADKLKAKGFGLIVVGPTPMFNFSDISLCEKQWFNPSMHIGCWVRKDKIIKSTYNIKTNLENLSTLHNNMWIFDPVEQLCGSGKSCSLERAGKVLYRDADHLSSLGAATLSLDFQKLLASKVHPALGE